MHNEREHKSMTDSNLLRILAATPPFADLPPRAVAGLAQFAKRQRYEPGQLVFAEGDPSEWAFVVESGRVLASKRSDEGVDVPMRQLVAGEAGGLTSVSSDAKRSASLRAVEETVLVTLPKADLFRITVEEPAIATSLLSFLGTKVRGKTRELATLLARHGHDPRELVAFFDTKPYDEAAFTKHLPAELKIKFLEPRLGPSTVALADGYPIVCAFVNDDLSAPVLEQLKAGGVELIVLRCAGYNNVDLKAAQKLGMSVVRVPAYSPYAVAEHAVALMLTLNRKTHRAYNRVREGNFSLSGLEGFDLHGRTAGIIGLGKIGRCLAAILHGFGMKILAHDAFHDDAYAKTIGLRYVGLDELLRESDIVSLHAPLLPDTYHLINAARIALMKRGVILINTSRGGLVDTNALVAGLKSGHIGAAGLDVYEEESAYFFEDRSAEVITDDTLARLMTFHNVLVTSHQAFLTEEALDNIAHTTLTNIDEYRRGLRGKLLTNAVLPAGELP